MATQSWNEVAERLGVNVRTLRKLRERPDWPAEVPAKMPRAGLTDQHVQIIHDWRMGFDGPNAPGPGGGDDVARALKQMQVLVARENMLRLKMERELKAGNFVPRSQLDAALGGLAKVFITALEELELGMPARLEGRNAAEIEKRLATWADSARKRIVDAGEFELLKMSEAAEALRRPRRGRPGIAQNTSS